jgi:hypothetical protein
MYGSVRLFSPSIRFFHRPWRRESSITEEKRKENKWKIEKIEKEGEKVKKRILNLYFSKTHILKYIMHALVHALNCLQ